MSPSARRVRPVEPRDRRAWQEMRRDLWPDADPGELAAEIDAFSGGACGFLELSLRSYAEGCAESPVPYVEAWWVRGDVRGSGLGRALIAAAEAWAFERGHHELASDALLGNPAGQAAHAAVGFREIGRSVQYRKALARP